MAVQPSPSAVHLSLHASKVAPSSASFLPVIFAIMLSNAFPSANLFFVLVFEIFRRKRRKKQRIDEFNMVRCACACAMRVCVCMSAKMKCQPPLLSSHLNQYASGSIVLKVTDSEILSGTRAYLFAVHFVPSSFVQVMPSSSSSYSYLTQRKNK